MSQLPELPQTYPYSPQPAVLPKRQLAADRPLLPLDRPPAIVWAAAIAIGCAAFNLLMPPIISSVGPEPLPLLALTLGMLVSQLAALSAVLVFGEARFWLRLLAVWAVGYGLALSFVAGVILVEGSSNVAEPIRIICCGLPLVALAVQTPLWAARLYCGWRIARPGQTAQQRPLSIGDILGGTAVAALTVGAVRFVAQNPRQADLGFWIGWGIAVPSIAGISLIAILPVIYFVLRVERVGLGCGLLIGYAAAAALIAMCGIGLVFSRSPPPTEFFFLLTMMIGTVASAHLGLLALIRGYGYRLIFPSDRWIADPDRCD